MHLYVHNQDENLHVLCRIKMMLHFVPNDSIRIKIKNIDAYHSTWYKKWAFINIISTVQHISYIWAFDFTNYRKQNRNYHEAMKNRVTKLEIKKQTISKIHGLQILKL